MAVAADSCSELGCGDPSMSLAWSACKFCSSQRCRAAAENLAVERWKVAVRLWAAKSWSETFLFILFRHKQQSGGNHFWSFTKSVWVLNQWPAGQRLHALFSPWRIKSIVVHELQVQPGFQWLLAFEAKYAAWVSPPCHTLAFHTVFSFRKANKVGWEAASHTACDGPEAGSFIPQLLYKLLWLG